MDIFGIFTMLGGLALFLYGMKIMGDNLSKMAGGKLAGILEGLTSNRFKAVILGAIVTAIIQSSSATTVMVVGFVNSGIMNLSQAIGVIMGANVGTTITSWILSLSGIQGEEWWIQMLKPSSFAPVIAFIGIIMLMTAKENDKKSSLATILIGFATLMFGMETMSSAVEPLADNPSFANLLLAFSNPILGVVVGALFTAIIQSSSASVGILQAFCLTGAVQYSTVIPIIMGQNIGTCITALISSIGANKNAKRASMMHLSFNLIGTVLFLIGFYGINAFVPLTFLSDKASPADIAIIHSLFNIGCTIVLFPFANKIIQLAEKIVVEDKKVKSKETSELSPILLDERFLSKPGFALEISKKNMANMAAEVEKSIEIAVGLLSEPYKKKNANRVKLYEDHIDEYNEKLGDYLLKISGRDLSKKDAENLVVMQHTLKDLEDIADYARGIQKEAGKISKKDLHISQKTKMEFDSLLEMVNSIVVETVDSFTANDIEKARAIDFKEEEIYLAKKSIKKMIYKQTQKGNIELELGLIFENLLIKIERVAAHCSNIAYTIISSES